MKERNADFETGMEIIRSDLKTADLLVPAGGMIILITAGRVTTSVSRTRDGNTIISHPGRDIVHIRDADIFDAAWAAVKQSDIPIA